MTITAPASTAARPMIDASGRGTGSPAVTGPVTVIEVAARAMIGVPGRGAASHTVGRPHPVIKLAARSRGACA